MNRDETLRRAEKLLRQGRVEAAIPEYARLVEASPRDWNTANLLGDLYVRAGRIDEAVGHYARIAEHLASEGFVSKATALYKKIVKIRPDDDAALLRTAELSASQGLTAEARVHLRALFAQRARRGDRAGASRAATALADLDPRDAAARAEIARMMADLGDAADAAAHLRAAGHAWLAAGQADLAAKAWREGLSLDPANEALAGDLLETLLAQGDLDGARDVAKTAGHWRAVADGFTNAGRTGDACAALERVLASEPADVPARIQLARAAIAEQDAARARALLAPVADNRDPAVLLGLAEIEFLSGSVEVGRAALERLLAASPELVQAAVEVGCDIGRTAPDKGFAVIGVAVKDAEAAGDTDAALEMIERFLAAAPGCIQALEDYIRLCGQGFYEHQRYRAQVQLADAYLSVGRWREARALAEALASARPDDSTHQRRLALASAGLGAAAGGEILPQSAPSPAEAPRGQRGPGEPDAPSAALVEDETLADVAVAPALWTMPSTEPVPALIVPPKPVAGAARAEDQPDALDFEAVIELTDEVVAPDAGSRLRTAEPEVFEIDLSGELDELMASNGGIAGRPGGRGPSLGPAGGGHPASLEGIEGYFGRLREQSSRDAEMAEAARAYDLASEHFNRGEIAEAEGCLRTAARDPLFRFRAASMLARIARDRGSLAEAIEWLERAGEALAPSEEASRSLLYELGDTLESAGEEARALAVFLGLASSAPTYRDVGARLARLRERAAGGGEPWRSPR